MGLAAGLVLAPAVAQAPAPGAPAGGSDPISRLLQRSGPAQPATPVQPRPAAPAPVVMSARIGEHADKTRLVLELSDPVALRAFSLSNPNRVVLDLPEVAWRLLTPPVPSGRGVIKAYRYGVFRPGSSRMVIDLSKPVRLAETLVLPPAGGFGYRVVIDLFPTTQTAFETDSGWPADLRKREADAERRAMVATAAPSGKRVVVIDPGHGGIDSGASGVNGLHEKDLVLAQSQLLARELRARGFSVYLTREKDSYVPLRDRVAFARAHKADLFLSMHADAHSDASVSGLSIYTLSDGRSDREAAALARRENQSDIIAGVDLPADNAVTPILIDLAQRDTLNKSSRFAKTAIAQLAGVTTILPRSPHRSASLAVLTAPDVPAVLVELGYLSNRADAAQMKTQSWREKFAVGLATAVVRHFAGETATRTAQDARAGTRQ